MIRDMTRGNVTRHLVGFSVPIILGNLFQLAYNAVDSIVVGRFAGTGALAAVGTANPVMNIIILGVSGLCIGASVLMSEYFGARDTEKLRREFAATLFLGMFFSAAVLALGLPLAGPLLRLLNVPDEIFPQARAYLCIIFLGMPFTFVYNAYAAAMRSVGDSRTPIRFWRWHRCSTPDWTWRLWQACTGVRWARELPPSSPKAFLQFYVLFIQSVILLRCALPEQSCGRTGC